MKNYVFLLNYQGSTEGASFEERFFPNGKARVAVSDTIQGTSYHFYPELVDNPAMKLTVATSDIEQEVVKTKEINTTL